MNASIGDLRQVLTVLRSLETTHDESVLERELLRKALDTGVKHSAECMVVRRRRKEDV